jgi:hypothetical protein
VIPIVVVEEGDTRIPFGEDFVESHAHGRKGVGNLRVLRTDQSTDEMGKRLVERGKKRG